MSEDMTYDALPPFDKRVTAAIAKLELRILHLEQRVTHNDAWLQRLLNPADDMMPFDTPTLFDNPQDGI